MPKLILLLLLVLTTTIQATRVCDCRDRIHNAVAKVTKTVHAQEAQIQHLHAQKVALQPGTRVVATLPCGLAIQNKEAFAPSLSFPRGTVFIMDNSAMSSSVIQSVESEWAIVIGEHSAAVTNVPSLVSKGTITSVPDKMALILFPLPGFKGHCQRLLDSDVLRDVSRTIGSYILVPIASTLIATLYTEPDMKGCEVPVGPVDNGSASTIVGGIHSLVVHTGTVTFTSLNGATRLFRRGVYSNINLHGDVYTVKAVETVETMGDSDVVQVCDGDLCHDMITVQTTMLPSFRQYTVPVGQGLRVETPFGTVVLVGHGELPERWCHKKVMCTGTVVHELPTDQPLFCKEEQCFYVAPAFTEYLQGITLVQVPNGYTVEVWWRHSTIVGSDVYAAGTHVVGMGFWPITKFVVTKA